ncbi:MAG: exodeoxyribonuclease V subunit gamma [Lachnospiraceae bacterium]|nr:exodeoxyribonuclease V subunit gamma [Lachnospiraceae bacterium]
MSLRFYVGSSGAGKSSRLQEDIIKRSIREPDRHFFVLVPDQFTMQTQKEMIERHPKHGFMNIEIFSFGRLAHYIFEEVGHPERIPLDDTGKNLILRKLASEMEEQLPVLGSRLKKTGYIHEVKSVISEFMQYSLDVREVGKLCDAVEGKPVLRGKLRDINLLYEKFLAYLGEKYITTEETMDFLAEALERSEIIRGSVVAMDGFTGFTPVQYKVISRLLSLCDEMAMTVILPAEEFGGNAKEQTEEELFALSKKTVMKMERLCKELEVSRGEDVLLAGNPVIRYRNQPVLAHLEQNIFQSGAGVFNGKPDGLSVFCAISPREEMKKIFISIRRLIREKKYAYRDIAVVTGDLERYAPYAAQLSEQYDIPIFIDNNRKLGLNPFTEYIKSGLKVIHKNFSYESVVHFLKCGFTGLSEEEIDRLENYMLALRIRGEKTWSRSFVRYPAYMKQKEEEQQQKELCQINASREAVMELLTPLLAMKKGGPAEKMVTILYHFIADHGIYEKLQVYAEEFKAQNDLVRASEYEQIYDYLMKLLEQMAALLEGEELTLEEFIEILEAGILELQVGILPQDIDRVIIGDIERTRLKQVKVLFFAGVNEGVIPKHSAGGGMISDLDREYIFDAGYELSPTPRQKMYTQRLYLYMNMTKPSEELYISYARTDAQGKALRPSYLLGTLHKLFSELEEHDTAQDSRMDDIVALKDAGEYLAEMLCHYAAQTMPEEEKPEFMSLYKVFAKKEAETLHTLKEAAFYRYQSEALGRETARALYGMVLENSISRMEMFARCAYAHFLQYGMQLQEREDYSFDVLDMGNFFHQALEQFGHKLQEKGLTWLNFSEEEAKELLQRILENIATEYGESVIYRDERTAYRLRQIHRILVRTVKNLQYQLKKGKFIPQEFEYSFRKEVGLDKVRLGLSEDEKMMLQGKIDRYDTYEKDDKIYVKVIDFKSRDKKVDLIQLYYGLQLQLAVYLEQASERVQKKHPEKKVVPAALFYYPVIDPVMDQENANVTTEEWENWMHERLRVSGYLLEDEEVVQGLDTAFTDASDVVYLERKKDGSYTAASQVLSEESFETINSYVNRMIGKIGDRILQGERKAEPCGETACQYCNFKEVCGFDPRLLGYQEKRMDIRADEVLERMKDSMADQDGKGKA